MPSPNNLVGFTGDPEVTELLPVCRRSGSWRKIGKPYRVYRINLGRQTSSV